jgi:hypothetical protein
VIVLIWECSYHVNGLMRGAIKSKSQVKTMESLQYSKAEDRVESSGRGQNWHALQLDSLPGIWRNTNSEARGIVKVEIAVRGPRLIVRAFGAGEPEPSDWGEVEAEHIFGNNISSHTAAGFTAQYDFDFSRVHLQANWNQGLLVLASFTSFKDGSRRSNYFSREFFHR